ncbi:hypothetical protein KQX64_04635 [Rhodopseudomonas palustris]|nr:hypothetical protein KQX64_04635 [Rhodopseudomonas palustris]
MPDEMTEVLDDNSLLLAAEECPQDQFEQYHSFTAYERSIIQRLTAHGPVLVRGGRGSGKSALLIESYLEMKRNHAASVLPIYISLRHLPLLRSEGAEYISNFCRILSREINKEMRERYGRLFPLTGDLGVLLDALETNAREIERRIVLLFDDAAHLGRERPLIEFFDIFRTISTSRISCKASIYPGVTKFGVRFDVFNDATVIDIARDERKDRFHEIFVEITHKRFPDLAAKIKNSRSISFEEYGRIMGRAVTGNLRSFVYACNMMNESSVVTYPELTKCLLELSANYFWPLLEEVAPKLGAYEVLIPPSQEIAQYIFLSCAGKRLSYCLVHRDIMQRHSKVFEILEYAGFIAKREASRSMKSGGRGAMFSLNLCNLLDVTTGRRLTSDLAHQWSVGDDEPFELHVGNPEYARIVVPMAGPERDPSVFEKPVETLRRSNAYPYGLTEDKIERLSQAGFRTVFDVANATDERILSIYMIGPRSLKRIRDVIYQAVWM